MLVLDSSVAVKLAVREERSDLALRLAESDEAFIAPELIWAEIASALWKKVKRKELDAAAAFSANADLSTVFSEIVSMEALRSKRCASRSNSVIRPMTAFTWRLPNSAAAIW